MTLEQQVDLGPGPSTEPSLDNVPGHDDWMTDDNGHLSMTGLRALEPDNYEITVTLGGVTETVEVELEDP